ncbi:MAG: tetratricopeptide repeat protein [bacterium]|nr:tetratricopeptide repeat protein [bacterium]
MIKSVTACFKNSPLFIFSISIFITLLFPYTLPAAEGAERSYIEGVAAYQNFTDSGIKESVRLFEAAIDSDPAFSPAYSALAESYIQLYYRSFENDPPLIDKAATMAEKALFIDARSPHAHKAIASVYFARGMIDEAIEELERGVDMEPRYARAWLNLGTSWLKLGEKDKGLGFFRRAIELDNDLIATAVAYYNIASVESADSEHKLAFNNYNLALKLLPGYFNIHYGKGVALMNLGRDDEAIPALEEAIRLKPDYPSARLALASAHHRLGNVSNSRKAYEAALGLDPDLEDAERGLAALQGKKPGCLFLY